MVLDWFSFSQHFIWLSLQVHQTWGAHQLFLSIVVYFSFDLLDWAGNVSTILVGWTHKGLLNIKNVSVFSVQIRVWVRMFGFYLVGGEESHSNIVFTRMSGEEVLFVHQQLGYSLARDLWETLKTRRPGISHSRHPNSSIGFGYSGPKTRKALFITCLVAKTFFS